MRYIHWSFVMVVFVVFGGAGTVLGDTPHGGLGAISEFASRGDTFDIRTTTGARIQIQVLTSDMFRIWAGAHDTLVDEGSHQAPIVLKQSYAPVGARWESDGRRRVISTGDFALAIDSASLTFELYRPDRKTLIWKELAPLHLSESGSYQTLSSNVDEHIFGGGQQNGSFDFKGRVMEISYSDGWEEGDRPNPAPFYMSSLGYGVLRNTWSDGRYDFFSAEYLVTSHKENRFDAYYFVGPDIKHVLDLYTGLTGRAALLPRWAFEFGDADCYNDRDNVDKPGTVPKGWSDGPTGTTPDVIETVAKKYRENDMPGGWILPNDGYGCGYKDLPKVVEGLRTLGFHTGLWTESGVEKIAWEVGQAGTRVQKLDVAWTGKGYQFALDANMEASRGILQNSDSRPFVWTVMGWAGIQRYAVTWTGDQSGSWDYIRWHVPTLIGSGLSGMVYSTGDVDGIYGGSPETYTRDLQWKCFTPVLMGMSGWSKNERKHPWWFDEPYRSINRKYLKLKMRLMPYMYTLAREAEQTGAPIVRGLMWNYPHDVHAFEKETRGQFLLGRDLLIAPVYRSQAASGGWRDSVYLPEGEWVDYWDGTRTRVGSEGRWIDYPVTLEQLPVFVRAGAIIPMYPEALYDGQVPKDMLTLDVYPRGESIYSLYEDDGNTRAYQQGEFSEQVFHVSEHGGKDAGVSVNIESAQGSFKDMYERRQFVLQVHSHAAPSAVTVDGNPVAQRKDASDLEENPSGWYSDAKDRHGVIYVKTDTVSVREAHHIALRVESISSGVIEATYPPKPKRDDAITADQFLVINRPAEEPGYALENAFDGNPATWFRTVRDQAISYGPHEFVVSFKDRKVIDGFQIAPRNDKWWRYGQVCQYEIYVSDVNGIWGDPIVRDTLPVTEGMQTVHFAPAAGRIVRFRVLSTQDMKPDSSQPSSNPTIIDALVPVAVKPVTIAEFHLLEHAVPMKPQVVVDLVGQGWAMAQNATLGDLQMHGLIFAKSIRTRGNSQLDYRLKGDWQTIRVEAGIDDRNRSDVDVRFQIYGNDKLLYDSGPIDHTAPAKFEMDIRGVNTLSLRTVTSDDKVTGGWAHVKISGFAGDEIIDR